jgi:peptide chain release factor 2
MNEYSTRLKNLISEIQKVVVSINLEQKLQRVLELEGMMQESDFWNDREQAQTLSEEYSNLKKTTELWQKLSQDSQDALDLLLMENVSEGNSDAEHIVLSLEDTYKTNRFVALLNGPYDDHEAIVSIHAGAGGTDAQDWAEMLLRMYLRFCEKKSFSVDTVDISKGGEAGVKSVTLHVKGNFAYGFLQAEAGVHRLVRLSPFNPAHTRETSFALVEVVPSIEEKEVALDPKDLNIEATTSSGHGGQSVNTTYSAIRITHIPTGLKVSIQNERSQHQNKELALKILTGKLKALESQRFQDQKKELRGEYKSAEWGNQIRSYVLHPYKLVKDHRTSLESTDPESVLDGKLDEFIEKFLEYKAEKENA